MRVPRDIFISPELYPLKANFERGTFLFFPMSRRAYQDFVDLGIRRVVGGQINSVHEIRIDDLLLGSTSAPEDVKPICYILHTAYCCSTLLARYLELLPACFVLKEPQLLAQFALEPHQSNQRWNEGFDLCTRLLSRTYAFREVPVIKANVPCNVLGVRLLEKNPQSVIIFLAAPVRTFVLAVLKLPSRRRRVRYWATKMINHIGADSSFANIGRGELTDSQTAVILWSLNHYFCRQLVSGPHGSRVTVVHSENLADSPQEVLPGVAEVCGLSLDNDQVKSLVEHPSVRRHSKDPSRLYNAILRRQEMALLQDIWGREADEGIEWALSRGLVEF